MLYESQYHIPTYGDDYENATDHAASYRYMRTLLQLRQALAGDSAGVGSAAGRRWVLKSPMHLESLRSLVTMLPEGFTLVRLHRDPLAVVKSLSTMLAYVQALQTDRPKPAAILEYWVGRLERMLRRMAADDDAGVLSKAGVQVVDLQYDELVRDPASAASAAFEAAGFAVSAEVRARLEAYVRTHPRNGTGSGRFSYDLTVFGSDSPHVTEEAIRRRFAFYTDRYVRASEA
jgi:hypothetical protein